MKSLFKPVMALALAAATVTATMATSTNDAEALTKRGRNALIIAGFGAAFLGAAAAASANSGPRYRDRQIQANGGYEDDYRRYPRHTGSVRYVDADDYEYSRPRCRVRYVRRVDDLGYRYHQKVRVCR
jgi:hypothetical protein